MTFLSTRRDRGVISVPTCVYQISPWNHSFFQTNNELRITQKHIYGGKWGCEKDAWKIQKPKTKNEIPKTKNSKPHKNNKTPTTHKSHMLFYITRTGIVNSSFQLRKWKVEIQKMWNKCYEILTSIYHTTVRTGHVRTPFPVRGEGEVKVGGRRTIFPRLPFHYLLPSSVWEFVFYDFTVSFEAFVLW